jgi:prevent-host-death family protein
MKTNIIGLKELRLNAENYIKEVGKGKSFVIVRRSKPIFKITPVDEWGDEGTWKTIADFSKDKRGGMPADDFLKALQTVKKNG